MASVLSILSIIIYMGISIPILFYSFKLYRNVVDLQCCVSFRYTAK